MNPNNDEPVDQVLPLMNRIRLVGSGERIAVELMLETPIRDQKRLTVLQYRLVHVCRMLEEDTQKEPNDVIEAEHAKIVEGMKPPEEKSNIIRPNGFSTGGHPNA